MASNPVQALGGIFPRGFNECETFPWPLVRSREIVELVYGDALTATHRTPGNVPVYGTNGQCGWHDVPLARGPGVILGRKGMGPLGVEWCDSDYWVIDTAYFVRPKVADLDLKFFYYVVKYIGLNHLKDGTSNPSLTRDVFGALLLPKPPLSVQRRIVEILSAFDDKIELNRRMNETLEAMARALFKSWFVDFEPVHAKAAGRQLPNLDPALAALFPDRFQDSVLGPIPAGWRVAALSEHVEALKGLSYKGDGLADEGVPMHNLNSVFEGGGYKHAGIKYYRGEYKERHVTRPGDVIVANTEQGFGYLLIGYPAIIPRRFGELGIFSHHIYRVRPLPASPLRSHFLCQMLMSPLVRDQVVGCTNGTTVNMLSVDGLQRSIFAIPPGPLIDRYERVATAFVERVEANLDETSTLASTRDALLPRLISGEVRVSVAQSVSGMSS